MDAGESGAEGAPVRGGGRDPLADGTALRMLDFERRWSAAVRRGPRRAGAREEAIRAEFGMGAVRYHQILNRLLDSPEVEAADPVTVHRLQRLRDTET